MIHLIEIYFQWPILPFSVLLCAVGAYWLLVLLGGVDLDIFDVDLDPSFETDVDASLTDFGMLGLRWLNIGEVPLMIWLTIVAMAAWLFAMIFDRDMVNPTAQESAISIMRSLGIGILAAKFLTNPMRGKLRMKEPHTVHDMLGRSCTVTTSEVTQEFGQAICHVEDGAPLRLNIRTLEGSVPRDGIVEIIDYSSETGLYFVKETGGPLT